MTKTGYETQSAIREVARQLSVHESDISCHGLKDRHAHTSQLIGVEGPFNPRFAHRYIFLRQVSATSQPLRLGGNTGNRFCIDVSTDAPSVDEEKIRVVPNYFGVQRIGDRESCLVGRDLFLGKFESATRRALQSKRIPQRTRNALSRNIFGDSAHKELWLSIEMQYDFKFALSKWRSLLWNDMLKQMVDRGGDIPKSLPQWTPDYAAYYRDLWRVDESELDQDVIRTIAHSKRPTQIEPGNISIEKIPSGFRIRFDLGPGAYATTVLSQIFQLEDPNRG